ncbi:multidrug efflux pump subunit AcrA (membrane-fusion protein) [Anaerotaenia torta]|uniref:efflux RND transporter periplasmic adaptor subunit n=1 Tax=Anaerotaenia torta TaxID=433293 RepID=UPI003D20D681
MVRRLVMIALAIMLLLGGCDKKDTVIPILEEPVEAEIDTAAVSRGDIYDLFTYDAKVYPEIHELSFPIDGEAGDIAVYMGQEVKKGDLLLSLEDENRGKELNRLKEELETTLKNNELDNKKTSLEIQIQELDILRRGEAGASAVEIARMEAALGKSKLKREHALKLQELDKNRVIKKIEEIEEELEKYKLKAPCSGSITYIKQFSGNSRINAYETAIIIADETRLHIQSDFISGSELSMANEVYALIGGRKYAIQYIPFETNELIKMKNSGIKPETRYEFAAGQGLTAGDYACVCLIKNFKKDVLIIPNNALYKDSSGSFVYRMVDGELVRSNVELGIKTNTEIEVIKGLEEGDIIYVQK